SPACSSSSSSSSSLAFFTRTIALFVLPLVAALVHAWDEECTLSTVPTAAAGVAPPTACSALVPHPSAWLECGEALLGPQFVVSVRSSSHQVRCQDVCVCVCVCVCLFSSLVTGIHCSSFSYLFLPIYF